MKKVNCIRIQSDQEMPFSSDSPPAAQEKAGLQHGSLNFLWQKALVADSRGAYGEITNRGIPN